MVQQDVYLFSGTIYDNIVYGKPGACREEVMEAAKMAGADEFIKEMAMGYDTYVGERGVKLDNESEKMVSRFLDKLAVGRTTLTIAHRLSTIRGADRILVLSGNRIEEEGSHGELMAKEGIYYHLYMSANGFSEEAAE